MFLKIQIERRLVLLNSTPFMNRLMAHHNKLLTKDALEFTLAEEPMLHQSVLKLLPTLHGLLYAIDIQDLVNAGDDKIEKEYQFLRSELNLMLAGKEKK